LADDLKLSRRTRRGLLALALLAAFAIPATCGIIPYRLANSKFSSRYTFGYIGDEYLYAARIQPLIPGTSATNPLNGVADAAVQSPFFLEDACRALMNVGGMDVTAFFWMWRLLFPVALAFSFILLAKACLPARRRPWMLPLVFAASGAALALVFLLYPLATPYPPAHGWIHRVPTNIEYVLSPLFAAALAAYAGGPSIRRALLLALAGAALIYLRPYLAIPWGLAAALAVAASTLQHRAWMPLLSMLAALLILLIPWWTVHSANAGNAVFGEMFARYYSLPSPGARPVYALHPEWPLFGGLALFMLLSGIVRRARVFALSCGMALLALPFITGLFSISSELHAYHRFGVFYLVALAACALLGIGHAAVPWRGLQGAARARQLSIAACLLACGTALLTAVQYARLDFRGYAGGTLVSVIDDHAYLPAYHWLHENSEPTALVLVDDGYDWSRLPEDSEGYSQVMQRMMAREDLFSIAARRRRIYHQRLYGHPLSDSDMEALQMLHRVSFGQTAGAAGFGAAVKKFKPAYILWRKTPPIPAFTESAPVPRGFGLQWKAISRIVYTDAVCEIWKLEYGQ